LQVSKQKVIRLLETIFWVFRQVRINERLIKGSVELIVKKPRLFGPTWEGERKIRYRWPEAMIGNPWSYK